MRKNKKFVSIIWGYSRHMYGFSPEENYHLHALKVAKGLSLDPVAIVRDSKESVELDPHFDPDIAVIEYRNIFQLLFHVIKFALQGSVIYVNSYEWQSFLIPFIARRTIFMAHTQPKRPDKRKQAIQNFVYRFFGAIRLNNKEEEAFLLAQNIPAHKLFVVPLVVSKDTFHLTETDTAKRRDLVYFGNVTEKKNLLTILRAFETAKRSRPDLRLHVIGNMWDPKAKAYIEESPLKADIVLHGYLPNDELVSQLNQRLVYLNSSLDEGQCVAVYDAALCGCALCLPSIMSFTGVFKDKALFHDVFDHEQLARNILTYLSDPDLVETYGKKNADMISASYSIEAIETKLKNLITYVERL